ncbi:MAG: pyruvate formate-lyase-activating protein [Oscillospiraceae bacterium]|nr:pyruvate formate-lyase-activating protein [Oscillospiraceae bacterium]
MVQGKVHSIESMGLVDGPGVRVVVFLQGCSLRCLFCHNPDTWPVEGGTEMSPQEVTRRVLCCKPYFLRGGGVTFSGGEPLLQPEFLLETLRLCKDAGIHTCLDTAGCGLGNYDELLQYTDLILYDVKQVTAESYRQMTGKSWDETTRFLAAVKKAGTPVWVRHVVVPGLTSGEAHMQALKTFIAEKVPNVEKVELLPYHLLGVHKYAALGLSYRLKGTPAMDLKQTQAWQQRYFPDNKTTENRR